MTVNGPSFTLATCIIAPNTPVSTVGAATAEFVDQLPDQRFGLVARCGQIPGRPPALVGPRVQGELADDQQRRAGRRAGLVAVQDAQLVQFRRQRSAVSAVSVWVTPTSASRPGRSIRPTDLAVDRDAGAGDPAGDCSHRLIVAGIGGAGIGAADAGRMRPAMGQMSRWRVSDVTADHGHQMAAIDGRVPVQGRSDRMGQRARSCRSGRLGRSCRSDPPGRSCPIGSAGSVLSIGSVGSFALVGIGLLVRCGAVRAVGVRGGPGADRGDAGRRRRRKSGRQAGGPTDCDRRAAPTRCCWALRSAGDRLQQPPDDGHPHRRQHRGGQRLGGQAVRGRQQVDQQLAAGRPRCSRRAGPDPIRPTAAWRPVRPAAGPSAARSSNPRGRPATAAPASPAATAPAGWPSSAASEVRSTQARRRRNPSASSPVTSSPCPVISSSVTDGSDRLSIRCGAT